MLPKKNSRIFLKLIYFYIIVNGGVLYTGNNFDFILKMFLSVNHIVFNVVYNYITFFSGLVLN